MLKQSTLDFLTNLKLNNNKIWFEENKGVYEEAKNDFENFVSELISGLTSIEPGFNGQKAKDCIFRIYRDVRFAKDKTPYKSNFGAYLSKGGKKFNGAGYYFHLDSGDSFAGGGLWMPEPNLLKAVRQEIDYNFTEFKSITEEKSFKKFFDKIEGEQLKSVPKGYDADNHASDYLKMKSFTVFNKMDDKTITSKQLVKQTLQVFTAMKPFIDFLNKSLD